MEQGDPITVTIVGGGLVGALSACFFAKRGHKVRLYEYREDIRSAKLSRGRSINLAMSARARAALRVVGLEDALIREHGIPMKGRMIHSTAGDRKPIPYGTSEQCIYSVGRKYLNEVLLTAAEKNPNVELHFQHKMVGGDLSKGEVTLESVSREGDAKHVSVKADLVVGADGAYSSVRKQLMKQPLFNYSQTYIEHGYMELCIPPTESGDFAMEPNFLHIWPRGTFMMIALPNQDRSWTVTLFMPFAQFKNLDTPKKLLDFFNHFYPDAVPLLGKEKLVKDFFDSRPSPLVSVKCKPYHVGSTAIIIGDAAHAMVPFYGQGMNAGFEDCYLLDNLLTKHKNNLKKTLEEFSEFRNPDAEAICNLAMYNYIEMRDLVNHPSFLIRKKFDMFLHKLMPNFWIPLYSSVTFSHMRYSLCIENRAWQDKILHRGLYFVGAFTVIGLATAAYKWQDLLLNTYTSVVKSAQLYF
ncbi:kynurenine 3-monooxygenase [Ischnura elegans]|uniref:kynurenine 3-monooxygenase n=1 Tax=Ischnura elegans TaxID=197161 RepID=UPI001ED8B495|nr:kynurenine 3-monooxygenase [Ischnura elegans]